MQPVYKLPEGAVTGIHTDLIPGKPDYRCVILTSHSRLLHFVGRTGKPGSSPIFPDLFRSESPIIYEVPNASQSAPSCLVTNPDLEDQPADNEEKMFAWLSSKGVFHGRLQTAQNPDDIGRKVLSDSKMIPRTVFPASESTRGGKKLIQDPVQAMTLTQFHILTVVEGRVVVVNRLNDKIVHDQLVLDRGQTLIGLFSDQKKNTFWVFTNRDIWEVVVKDEDRDVWGVMLEQQNFEAASRYAKGPAQKDAVASATGDFLASKNQWLEAASIWGKSSKPFEEVCLKLIDNDEQDALRKYLLTKLSNYSHSAIMQRMMIASWLVEVYMTKLNSLDDTVATKAELTDISHGESKTQLKSLRNEFYDFIRTYQEDLDPKTVYEIIGSHGREEELLFYADTTNDYYYVIQYWVHRERWTEALDTLKKQTDPEVFYKYSSVLMMHVANGVVDILQRHTNLDPEKIIPALLSYHKVAQGPLNQNQAIRYLNFVISAYPYPSAAVHNTLISLYASHPSPSESALLYYLEAQPSDPPPYDADFALRLCSQHSRVQSCVHIYSAMGQYMSAVQLALSHNDIDLAALVADRPETNPKLRKKLWLLVAEKKIQSSPSIKSAIAFLKRCELLRIEDLIPFFPDFVVIDDFKEEICDALESYSRHIDSLRAEMDASAATAAQITDEISDLDSRFAIVEPGEKCWICDLPVLWRQFFVFPCQHSFHSDCLGRKVLESAGPGRKRRIRELQEEVAKGADLVSEVDVNGDAGASGRAAMLAKRDKMVKELDDLVAESCVLCGELAVKGIDEPFVKESESRDRNEWAL